jgi:co-chaperonin GroES (HSP10)
MAAVKGNLRPLRDKVIVTDMNFDMETTKGGILLHSDDGKSSGLHPRWARILFIGPEQQDVKVGQWVLMQHGRWTRAHKYEDHDGNEIKIHMIDLGGILGVQDEKPDEDGVRVSIGKMAFNIPGA